MNNKHQKVTRELLELLCERLNGEKISGCNSTDFWRSFKFEANGQKYRMEWYHNICGLYIGDVQIIFTHISIDSCWPNRYDMNINLGNESETFAVIPIGEKYEYE